MKNTLPTVRFLSFILCTLFLLNTCGSDSAYKTEAATGEETVEGEASKLLMFVGTYTKSEPHVKGKAEGVYQMLLDPATGQLQQQGVTKDVVNPSFIAISPNRKYLYAVNEVGADLAPEGWITAFRIDPNVPRPILLNRHTTKGQSPCHIVVEQTGQYALVANYVGGVVAMLPIQEDGKLRPSVFEVQLEGSGPHPQQQSSHPHMVCLSPDNRFVYIPDKGADRIHIFWMDLEDGRLVPATYPSVKVQPGAGPRHMTFHPNNRFAYLINELDATVNAYSWDPSTGMLEEFQSISTLPENFESSENYCADIHISPDGRFLYGSNRGHDSIVIYAIDQENGELTLVGHEATRGEFPRNFLVSPEGGFLYVANQNTDNITIFERNADRGTLTYNGQFRIPTPVCLKVW